VQCCLNTGWRRTLNARCCHTPCSVNYEVVSKIFRSSAAIYTAAVVARSTVPNRPNCDFRVLLRRFAATAWKRAKTSPRTWREPTWLLHHDKPRLTLPSSPSSFWRNTNGCHPPTPYSPDLTLCDFILFTEMKLKLKGRRFDTTEEIQAESQRKFSKSRILVRSELRHFQMGVSISALICKVNFVSPWLWYKLNFLYNIIVGLQNV
jgi:hypothetical protein